MNAGTTQRRKLACLGGILALFVPIIGLGMPGAPADPGSGQAAQTGGYLSALRNKYDLGESDLGDVDPSSSAMNLVLLGLRGVAANVLWTQMDEAKDHKDWATMRALTESIIKLQPHFTKVWDYNGWNLAYNVSAEWDDVRDRYHWVKEGGQFLQRGVARNQRASDLPWHVGRIYGPKIGQSDETRFFRRLFNPLAYPRTELERFLRDPNLQPDPVFNPDGKDNFLVAKDWFVKANESERNQKQGIMDRSLFRSYPARAQLDYANSLQKDGQFGDRTREAWVEGREDWIMKYGRETFRIENDIEIQMEMLPADVERIAKQLNLEPPYVARMVDQYQKIVNYRYWRTRVQCESEPDTADARRDIYDAGQLYRENKLTAAVEKLNTGMERLDKILVRPEYSDLLLDGALVEEALMAVMLRNSCYQLLGQPAPDPYPLKKVWDENQAGSSMEYVTRDFERLYLRN